MKIILDANFLVYCTKQKIDYISQMPAGQIVVLSSVIEEIKNLRNNSKKAIDQQTAKLTLKILEKNIQEGKIKVFQTGMMRGDDDIIANVMEGDTVATMDYELKKRLKGQAKILSIRGKMLERV